MDTDTHRDEPLVSERAAGAGRMRLDDEEVRRIGTTIPSTGLECSESLIREYAWSKKTNNIRNSQWRTWVALCNGEGRPILNVTEANIFSFICWLRMKMEADRREVSSYSLPQYLSELRQM